MNSISMIARCNREAQTSLSTKQILIVSLAVSILAASLYAYSAWANIQIASINGTAAVLTHSPYTIVLPIILLGIAIMAILHLVIPSKQKEEIVLQPLSPIVPNLVKASMSGICHLSHHLAVGDFVQKGATLFTLECMKMYIDIKADVSGTIQAIYVKDSEQIISGQMVISITPEHFPENEAK